MKRRGVRGPLLVLLALHLPVLAAGWLSPYAPEQQHRLFPWAPPTPLRFVDAEGGFHLRPFVYALTDDPDSFGGLIEDTSERYPVRLLVRDASGRTRLIGVDEPARLFLLGSDGLGRDVLTRLLHGGRVSLLAALLAAVLSSASGLLLGTVAGYRGGLVDAALMRLSELFLSLPWLYLLFAVRAFFPLEMDPVSAFLLVALVIGLVDWARPARLVRGVALSAKQRDYVRAARGFGAGEWHLIRHHVAPQALAVLTTQAALVLPQYVVAEVTLSFLGLGVGEPAASWGSLLAALQEPHVLERWWMWSPALALVAVVFAYYGLADRLRHELR